MATRREAREWAVQLLFQLDLNPPDEKGLDPVFERFWEGVESPAEFRAFAERLVRGVLEHRVKLDKRIAGVLQNWEMKRLAVVDRNILRLAAFELYHCPDIPPVVTINEAVDVAKYFGTAESGRFVNGILDQLRKGLTRPPPTAGPAREG